MVLKNQEHKCTIVKNIIALDKGKGTQGKKKKKTFLRTQSGFPLFYPCEIKRIYYECEGGIKNLSGGSLLGITRLAE